MPNDLVEDRGGDGERLGRGHLGEVGRDVVRSRVAPALGEPALGEADEDARVSTGARRVVLMREVAGAAGEEHDDGDDELRLDRPQERGLRQELLAGRRRSR